MERHAASERELDDISRELHDLGASLIDSYRALERRAQRVENELEQANAELARRLVELSEMSERVHALDKLAALGNMAGGIAHELRNPMMAIKGFAALLESHLPGTTRERRWAELIVAGVADAEGVLSSMLSLAAPEKLALETIDAGELARAAVELVQAERAHTADAERWRITCSADAPPFAGDRIKLRQALRNLLANAVQAQPDGGDVRLTLRLEAGEIVARVCDAGPGIADELRRRVCEPFFTTRAEGTGLGLALVVRIAELHGGRLVIAAAPSDLGGADVALRFPFRSPVPS